MKNKDGFTLIELLAVIVILAIIALIATPIIMNVINDAKIGALKSSAQNYIKGVELSITKKLLTDVDVVDDGDYLIDYDGSIEKYNRDKDSFVKVLSVDMKGEKPNGSLKIKNHHVVAMDLNYKDGNFIYDGTKFTSKTKGNIFPSSLWQTNEFDNYNGTSSLMDNGTVKLKYTGKDSPGYKAVYTKTDALLIVNKYDGELIFKHGMIVKPNTKYRFSVKTNTSNRYRLYAFYSDPNFSGVEIVEGDDSVNYIEFTTDSNTKYATFRIDLYDCSIGTTADFTNIELVTK